MMLEPLVRFYFDRWLKPTRNSYFRAPTMPFRFLDLPTEVRLRVYDMYYSGSCTTAIIDDDYVDQHRDSDELFRALRQVNKQIRDEAERIYYRTTTVRLVCFGDTAYPEKIRSCVPRLPRYPWSLVKSISGALALLIILHAENKTSIKDFLPALKWVTFEELLTVDEEEMIQCRSLFDKDFDFYLEFPRLELEFRREHASSMPIAVVFNTGGLTVAVTMFSPGGFKILSVESFAVKVTLGHVVEALAKIGIKSADIASQLASVPYTHLDFDYEKHQLVMES